MRVEISDGGGRDVLETEQASPDQALALLQTHRLHFGVLSHVLVQWPFHVICSLQQNISRVEQGRQTRLTYLGPSVLLTAIANNRINLLDR